jgi:protein-disulfide isomerase
MRERQSMKKVITLGASGIAIAFLMLAGGLFAERPDAHAQGTEAQATLQRSDVEAIVRDYLLANPELLLEVQDALEEKQKEAQQAANLQTIEGARDDIFNAAYDGVVGNPEGTVTIVEFYDYNCGYCKRAQEDMLALTKADPDLRFVLKEFPILGPDSQKAHIVSMAVHRLAPEKYGEFHNRLLGATGRATEASALAVATELGLDETKLREEMKSPEITEAFAKTYELANKLSITGTPSYVVGNEVIFGALGQEVLSQKIAEAKQACNGEPC